MPATLTEEKILRRLEVCALFISFAPFLFSPMFSCFNRNSPLFPGFCSRPTEKKQFLLMLVKQSLCQYVQLFLAFAWVGR